MSATKADHVSAVELGRGIDERPTVARLGTCFLHVRKLLSREYWNKNLNRCQPDGRDRLAWHVTMPVPAQVGSPPVTLLWSLTEGDQARMRYVFNKRRDCASKFVAQQLIRKIFCVHKTSSQAAVCKQLLFRQAVSLKVKTTVKTLVKT